MKQIISIIGVFLFIGLLSSLVIAIDLDDPISPEDQATFDSMLEPVMKIYNLIKYSATAIAAIMLLFAGTSYMTAGSDNKKRDTSKNIATYVIIGLVIIWATPIFITYFLG